MQSRKSLLEGMELQTPIGRASDCLLNPTNGEQARVQSNCSLAIHVRAAVFSKLFFCHKWKEGEGLTEIGGLHACNKWGLDGKVACTWVEQSVDSCQQEVVHGSVRGGLLV